MAMTGNQLKWWTALPLYCFLFACENNPRDIDALSRKVTEVETGKNIKGLFSQSGQRKAYLTAPVMKRVKADTLYADFPNSIHVDFFDAGNRLQNVVQAKFARYYETMGKVLLKDSVMVYNMTGDTLHCHTLWWDQAGELFYTDDSVTVNTLTQNIRGTGFSAKSDFSKYTILNTVGSVLMPGNSPDTVPATPVATPGRTDLKYRNNAPR